MRDGPKWVPMEAFIAKETKNKIAPYGDSGRFDVTGWSGNILRIDLDPGSPIFRLTKSWFSISLKSMVCDILGFSMEAMGTPWDPMGAPWEPDPMAWGPMGTYGNPWAPMGTNGMDFPLIFGEAGGRQKMWGSVLLPLAVLRRPRDRLKHFLRYRTRSSRSVNGNSISLRHCSFLRLPSFERGIHCCGDRVHCRGG